MSTKILLIHYVVGKILVTLQCVIVPDKLSEYFWDTICQFC